MRGAADLVDIAEADRLRAQLRALRSIVTELQPGTFDKTFVEDVWERDPAMLTENQRNQVRRLAHKHRRQMPCELVPGKVNLPRGMR